MVDRPKDKIKYAPVKLPFHNGSNKLFITQINVILYFKMFHLCFEILEDCNMMKIEIKIQSIGKIQANMIPSESKCILQLTPSIIIAKMHSAKKIIVAIIGEYLFFLSFELFCLELELIFSIIGVLYLGVSSDLIRLPLLYISLI